MHPNFCLANWPIAFPQKSKTLRLQSTLFPAHQRHVQCTCNDHSMHTMIARCTSRNCSIYCLLRTLANRKPNMYIMWKNTLYTLIVLTHQSNWTQIFVVTEQWHTWCQVPWWRHSCMCPITQMSQILLVRLGGKLKVILILLCWW